MSIGGLLGNLGKVMQGYENQISLQQQNAQRQQQMQQSAASAQMQQQQQALQLQQAAQQQAAYGAELDSFAGDVPTIQAPSQGAVPGAIGGAMPMPTGQQSAPVQNIPQGPTGPAVQSQPLPPQAPPNGQGMGPSGQNAAPPAQMQQQQPQQAPLPQGPTGGQAAGQSQPAMTPPPQQQGQGGATDPMQMLQGMARQLKARNPGEDNATLAIALEKQVAMMKNIAPDSKIQMQAELQNSRLQMEYQAKMQGLQSKEEMMKMQHEFATKQLELKTDAQKQLLDLKFGQQEKMQAFKMSQNQSTLSDEEKRSMAEQYLAGDKSVLQNLGRGVQGSSNLVAIRGEIAKQAAEQGMSGKEIATRIAEFEGSKAGERALGTKTATVEMAAGEFQNLAPAAIKASNAVNRTSVKSLNSLLMTSEDQISDPNLIELRSRTNSLINVYARAISPTGTPTVSDKDHAREILDQAWSKGGYERAVQTMQNEISQAQKAPGQVKERMREGITGNTSSIPDGWSVEEHQ